MKSICNNVIWEMGGAPGCSQQKNERKKEMSRHPLEVQGAKSEKRFLQPRAEIFRPTPLSVAAVAVSTGGKTSQLLTIANHLYPIMDRIFLFSTSHKLDPAWTDLKD